MGDTTSQIKSTVPKLHRLEFEAFPKHVRFKIYRLLLLMTLPDEYDQPGTDEDDNEDENEKTREKVEHLRLDPIHEEYSLCSAILRTSKMNHAEAVSVLWGENYFTGSIDGHRKRPLWHFFACKKTPQKTKVVRKYSRLITRPHLIVSLQGPDDDPFQSDALDWTMKNLRDACKKLYLNDLKLLVVDFFNASPSSLKRKYRWYGQDCLDPLRLVRADKVWNFPDVESFPGSQMMQFIINDGSTSRPCAAQLKAVIESPKGVKFLARRKAKEEKPESDFDARSDGEDESGDELYSENSDEEDVGFGSDGVDDESLGSTATHGEGIQKEHDTRHINKPRKMKKLSTGREDAMEVVKKPTMTKQKRTTLLSTDSSSEMMDFLFDKDIHGDNVEKSNADAGEDVVQPDEWALDNEDIGFLQGKKSH
ncbi:hypothetical protein P7C71_g6152, partial [Lecanoromycetidae sp. Uapishka_2]